MRSLRTGIVLLLGLASTPAMAADPDGPALYAEHCARCHGASGSADTPVGRALKVPKLRGEQWEESTPEAIAERVRSIDKHQASVEAISPDQLAAIARAVQLMSTAAE